MRIWHTIGGTIAVGLGVYGIYDEYFVVIEFLKGVIQPVLFLFGLLAILAGILTNRIKYGQIVLGLGLTGLGVYGFFDEYYATLDFFKGSMPPLLLILGMVSVVGGVRQLE